MEANSKTIAKGTMEMTAFYFLWLLTRKISLNLSSKILYWGLYKNYFFSNPFSDVSLQINLWGKTFSSPLGIAAGFDKTGKVNDSLADCGFGFIEFGTVTPLGSNAFLKKEFISSRRAILVQTNGFPNKGIDEVIDGLIQRRHMPHVAGINISTDSDLGERDFGQFVDGIEQALAEITGRIAPYCDYITLNLSNEQTSISTLTQSFEDLRRVIQTLQSQIHKSAPIAPPKLLIKIPCNEQLEVDRLSSIFIDEKVDGIIIGGYSKSLPAKKKLHTPKVDGFVSGAPILDISTSILRRFHCIVGKRISLIACGGVFTGQEAFNKIRAGASLVQLYSAIFYRGPGVANQINMELAHILKANNFQSIEEAIGADNFTS